MESRSFLDRLRGKRAESFPLGGLFETVVMDERSVGRIVFRVPAIESVEKLFSRIRPDVLAAIDAEKGTDHKQSLENLLSWLRRGMSALSEAERYVGDASKDLALEHGLEVARDAFRKAQSISVVLDRRYYPEEPTSDDFRTRL